MSGVIYKYTCAKCKLSYVGSTWRFWERRLQEHLHVSVLTGNPLTGLQIYMPMEHLNSDSCQQTINNRNDFKILGYEKDHYLLWLKENLFIYKEKPELNGNKASVPLYLFI